jgi:tRNA-dihydrouridine synthase B
MRIIGPRGVFQTEDFCRALLEAGADLLMIHGRTPEQRYEGAADRQKVCDAASLLPGRVAASGDYYAPSDAAAYLSGGCVAVLAARGALRDAFLIPKTLDALGYDVPENFVNPTTSDQINAVTELARDGLAHEGERFMLVLVKRVLAGLFKSFPGAANIRAACADCRDLESLDRILSGFAKRPAA